VSGSKDTCVIVWNVISSPSTKRIDPTPRHILRAHGISQTHTPLCLDWACPVCALVVTSVLGFVTHVCRR
jgi:hypothetical protein